ncbi:putative two-component response regulator autolysis regulator LytR [Pedobacter sp. BAL39]|uniref:LytR/AlgR family response regulator transcription factor n=1 Tax=Pedobacter sp. BAL39 TaxID=391596 RepID=UPI000155997C|nr:LytTR family DNA-binding domain-containing protein [Pedobacter sp. BAL39]EDM38617.1 putative two-component response regulator autolysis regulator LytR [Pedobacter sp. BAL39]
MRVVIIEDETKTARELKGMLQDLDSEIQVEVILASVASAISWFKENAAPELIFSDIQLGDGLSFEVFKEVQTESPVIFCTAFDEYAIRAFESNSIDYLLKPLEEEKLQKSLEKYTRFKEHLVSDSLRKANMNKVLTQMDVTYKQNILVHYKEKILPIRVADIQFVYGSNGVVQICTSDRRSYPIHYTIEQMESMLNPGQFFRANRKFIVNREAIQNIEHYFNRKLFVSTSCETPEKIVVSKMKSQPFLKWMEQ